MRGATTRLLAAACAWLMFATAPGARQIQPSPGGVEALLRQLEQVVRAGDPTAYASLLAADADRRRAEQFAEPLIQKGATRVVVRERDRVELPGLRSGDGYRLAVDVFTEFGRRATMATCMFDVVRQQAGGSTDPWLIKAQENLSSVGGIYNLALGTRQFVAKNLVLASEDFELRLPAGTVFTAETEAGPTVLVLLGRGQMIFRPTPRVEREQMRIFAGQDAVDTSFSAAFVRLPPSALDEHVAAGTMTEQPVNPDDARAAAAIFREDNPKSFGVNLGDLTSDTWSLVPSSLDFLAEVHTKRFGVLTYARSMHEAEDLTLFDRASKRNIAVYASRQKLERRGFFYDEDDGHDYEVIHYDVDASLDPIRQSLEGTTRLIIETRAASANMLTLVLADTLAIQSVVSREYGRLVAIRIRNQNSFLVHLPESVPKGTILGITIAYSGRITPQMIDREAITLDSPQNAQETDEPMPLLLEPSYLYSNRSYWYPQGETTTFATATLRVRVPSSFACVASGDPVVPLTPGTRSSGASNQATFRALQPVRYLSVFVTRLLPVRSQIIPTATDTRAAVEDVILPTGVYYREVELDAFASPRLRARASSLADRAGDILRFYSSLVGDCPYPTLTLAMVERELPGGHSPGYLAVVSEPISTTRFNWRSDPASFPDYPEFFIAHEIAHQWWGQGVGWKNYHEQWLSEGIAQYFAALYAQHLRGNDVFDAVVRRMQNWAMSKSDEGPVYLGYRIGHVKSDAQLFRAVVYNKSAVVLHMLRRLLGDEAFFGGLRRFYQQWRFRKAGSDDLRRAFEAESHRSLTRFFERWVYDSRLPRLRFSWRVERDGNGQQVAVVRFEQVGDVFDVPVTVTLAYSDRPAVDIVVPVTDAATEVRVPLVGRLQGVEANRDRAAVARIEK